jgi:hypothetical protein
LHGITSQKAVIKFLENNLFIYIPRTINKQIYNRKDKNNNNDYNTINNNNNNNTLKLNKERILLIQGHKTHRIVEIKTSDKKERNRNYVET